MLKQSSMLARMLRNVLFLNWVLVSHQWPTLKSLQTLKNVFVLAMRLVLKKLLVWFLTYLFLRVRTENFFSSSVERIYFIFNFYHMKAENPQLSSCLTLCFRLIYTPVLKFI